MAHTDRALPLHARCVDLLFAQSSTAGPTIEVLPQFPDAGFPAGPPAGAVPEILGGLPPESPPALDTPEGLQAAHEWFRTEKARLEAYTRAQFAGIHKQHQALLAKHLRSEEALAVRSQELNREMQYLATQAGAMQRRSWELSEWERALADQMAKLTQAQEELIRIQQTSDDIQKDTEIQHTALAQLRAETERVRASETAARTTFQSLEHELQERQRGWEKKQADLEQRHAAMEQRHLALEKAEAAAQRRMAKLDELEERLRQELEAQERQQARERQELKLLGAKVEAEAEQALQRRLAELDELEERLRAEMELQQVRQATEHLELQILRARLRA